MKIKRPSWLIVATIALYLYGISIGAGWQWYFQDVFGIAFCISIYLSNN